MELWPPNQKNPTRWTYTESNHLIKRQVFHTYEDTNFFRLDFVPNQATKVNAYTDDRKLTEGVDYMVSRNGEIMTTEKLPASTEFRVSANFEDDIISSMGYKQATDILLALAEEDKMRKEHNSLEQAWQKYQAIKALLT